MQKKPLILALLAGVALSGAAQAALIDRGGGMIYDTDRNITWLADANYAKTSGYDADGEMNWTAANAWAGGLVYGGYDDWRLPTTLQPDASCSIQSGGNSSGANCTGSEMGHLFYNELGGTAGQGIQTSGDPDLALFQNNQSFIYWTGTEYAPDPYYAWYFNFNGGDQIAYPKYLELWAWAVRSGDGAPVPVPAAAWLLGSGLLGLIGVARRRG